MCTGHGRARSAVLAGWTAVLLHVVAILQRSTTITRVSKTDDIVSVKLFCSPCSKLCILVLGNVDFNIMQNIL